MPEKSNFYENTEIDIDAVVRAYEKGKGVSSNPTVTEESKRILFGQKARRS
ncbi:hypothetical protein [Myxosarcina sp. GI1(2024)]